MSVHTAITICNFRLTVDCRIAYRVDNVSEQVLDYYTIPSGGLSVAPRPSVRPSVCRSPVSDFVKQESGKNL